MSLDALSTDKKAVSEIAYDLPENQFLPHPQGVYFLI
jgi:hypothetical protein